MTLTKKGRLEQARIDAALEYVSRKAFDLGYAESYGDPGHDQPERGILLANWNPVPNGLQHWLENCGYALEWSDEWSVCGNGKAWRMSPDGYGWEPNAEVTHDGELLTRDEGAAAWITFMQCDKSGQPERLLPSWVEPDDLREAGFELFEGDKETGWHLGQTDSPKEVSERAWKEQIDAIVFRRTEASQFYSRWEAWVRPTSLEDLAVQYANALDPIMPQTPVSLETRQAASKVLERLADELTRLKSELEAAPSVWDDNSVQFPRLLAEIAATQKLDMSALTDSMDLSLQRVDELFDRAQSEWERIKASTKEK